MNSGSGENSKSVLIGPEKGRHQGFSLRELWLVLLVRPLSGPLFGHPGVTKTNKVESIPAPSQHGGLHPMLGLLSFTTNVCIVSEVTENTHYGEVVYYERKFTH